MSKIVDKIAPRIKLFEYLGEEIDELKRVFDRNWKREKDDWRFQSIDYQHSKLKQEIRELDGAIKTLWEGAVSHSSLIPRMKQTRLEFLEVALYALKGADKTNREIAALKKRDKKSEKEEVTQDEDN